MRLDAEFYRLPLCFDAARLREEVSAFDDSEWSQHPQGFAGNSALILVSARGGINDLNRGPMAPTPHLDRCPYVRQVLAAFRTVVGRSRLMRLAPGARVPAHTDLHYYWHRRVRVHIPIVTHPEVPFTCGAREVHMGAGEAWLLDTWRTHAVRNDGPEARVHLVFDTVGTAAFWKLVDRSDVPASGAPSGPLRFIEWDPTAEPRFMTERYNLPVVMAPAELEGLIEDAVDQLDPGAQHRFGEDLSHFLDTARQLVHEWRATWAVHGDAAAGVPFFLPLRDGFTEAAAALPDGLRLGTNGQRLSAVVRARVAAALNPDLASPTGGHD